MRIKCIHLNDLILFSIFPKYNRLSFDINEKVWAIQFKVFFYFDSFHRIAIMLFVFIKGQRNELKYLLIDFVLIFELIMCGKPHYVHKRKRFECNHSLNVTENWHRDSKNLSFSFWVRSINSGSVSVWIPSHSNQ